MHVVCICFKVYCPEFTISFTHTHLLSSKPPMPPLQRHNLHVACCTSRTHVSFGGPACRKQRAQKQEEPGGEKEKKNKKAKKMMAMKNNIVKMERKRRRRRRKRKKKKNATRKADATPTCTVRSSEARLVSLESIYDRTCNPTDPQTRKESEGNRVKWQIYSGLNEVIIDHNSIEFNSQGQ